MSDEGHSEAPEGQAGEPEGASAASAAESLPAPASEEGEAAPSVVQKHFVAPALIPLERVLEDASFLVRGQEDLDDVSALATDIARLGQLFPIDLRLRPPDSFQIVTGFRRVAALRLLQREKVLALLHADLSDGDAMLMALGAAIHGRSVPEAALLATRERLAERGQLSAAARDMLDKALAKESGLGPEQVEEEVDADELAAEVTVRLAECNGDLNLLADVFGELDEGRRAALLEQLRYSAELVQFLENRR